MSAVTDPAVTTQSFPFQAEVSQILDLVIHSLYSHKEVFLRELISNASDALDKLRFRALTEPSLLAGDLPLEIRLVPDAKAGTLTLEDSGVGMGRDELIANLGTIAHSGTRELLEQMKRAGKTDASFIGQFGVGFYSAYLVADRVVVESRAAGATEAFRWSSDAKSGFLVEPIERAATGTSVVLHLKEDQREFLEAWKLEELVRRYSDFVAYPILVQTERTVGTGDDAKTETTFETANRASALWQRPRAEITDEQHAEFFKHLTHEGDEPLARAHFTVEGTQVFTALLYIPKHPPMFESHEEKRGVRLFVKRVFIMDDARELLPPWMRFLRGVVDSDDLPLNVSRETLQDSQIVRTIKRQVTKKVLDLLEELAKEKPADFATFWRSWGVSLKEAVATDWEHKERVAKLLRYPSSKSAAPVGEAVEGAEKPADGAEDTKKDDSLVSLETYVARMPEGQPGIYYVLGESEKTLASSPHIEALAKRGYEVLFLTDPVDELVADALRTFEGKPLVSAMRADLKLGDGEQEKTREAQSKELEPFLARVKAVLADQVAEVRVSARLTDSPCCLVVGEGQHHAYLEQVLRRHGREAMPAKRTLEINAEHPLVASLKAEFERDAASPRLVEWIELLHDQALLTEGSKIADPNRFARRLTELLQLAAQRT
jgi:molecular chaperone HtpG